MNTPIKCKACEMQVRLNDIALQGNAQQGKVSGILSLDIKVMANDIKLNLDILIELYYRHVFNVDSIVRDDYNVIVKNFDQDYGLNQLMLAGNSMRTFLEKS